LVENPTSPVLFVIHPLFFENISSSFLDEYKEKDLLKKKLRDKEFFFFSKGMEILVDEIVFFIES
jgi:hypothetical protein